MLSNNDNDNYINTNDLFIEFLINETKKKKLKWNFENEVINGNSSFSVVLKNKIIQIYVDRVSKTIKKRANVIEKLFFKNRELKITEYIVKLLILNVTDSTMIYSVELEIDHSTATRELLDTLHEIVKQNAIDNALSMLIEKHDNSIIFELMKE